MSRHQALETKLRAALTPIHLVVENESGMHNVPKNSETHFRVLVVSEAFNGLSAIDRHRRVQEILKDEFATGLHALTIRPLTPEQWASDGTRGAPSPPCLGGSK